MSTMTEEIYASVSAEKRKSWSLGCCFESSGAILGAGAKSGHICSHGHNQVRGHELGSKAATAKCDMMKQWPKYLSKITLVHNFP